MQRIIISISELNKQTWALISAFCNTIIENKFDDSIFQKLSRNAEIRTTNEYLDLNVFSIYGKTLIKNLFNKIIDDEKFDFVVLYKKNDNRRDLAELIPFFYLEKKYPKRISLGININDLSEEERGRYYFSSSQFLLNYKGCKNIFNGNQIYFIENWENVNKVTGEINRYKTKSLANEDSKRSISRYFSPLIEVNEENKKYLFGIKNILKHNEISIINYIQISIIKTEIKAKKLRDKYVLLKFKNLFEEFFIKSFLSLVEPRESLFVENDFEDIISLLKSYCDNIKELIENIIFYTKEKNGFFFFVLNKKSDVSEKIRTLIEKNEQLPKDCRLLEIHIIDFNEKGILDTFKGADEEITLSDFFDIKSIHATNLNHLDLRYTAHLGLKSFSKSIINNKGYFRVETNNNNSKQCIECFIDNDNNLIIDNIPISDFFINGTHYEIILPVKKSRTNDNHKRLTTYQTKSFIETYKEWLNEKNLSFQIVELKMILKTNNLNIDSINSKEEQIKFIVSLGNKIREKHKQQGIIAIDINECISFDNGILFKLLSYLQLSGESHFEIIVLYHVHNEFITNLKDDIQRLLVDTNLKIWNNDTALVLISENLGYHIINGETPQQVNHLNKLIQTSYPNPNYFIFKDENKSKEIENINISKFLLPYEMLIKKENDTIFEQYVSQIIDNNIEEENIGYRLNSKYTKLGSKIITKYYYEADSLFQNSFFVDRFAYLISRSIIDELEKPNKKDKKIVLIGYCLYAELLLKTIQRFINARIHSIVIAKDVENDKWSFEIEKKEEILKNPTNFYYITIVPIGSTTTTNDKLIAKFKQLIIRENQSVIDDSFFIYNSTVILVRDDNEKTNESGITEMENRKGWNSCKEKIIETRYVNSRKVHFFVLKNGYWLLPINKEISFPANYWEEKPVNLTKNSSLNTQYLLGFPKVKNITLEKYCEELKRLDELKSHIYEGHIVKEKDHHRYYIDTESFVKQKYTLYKDWLNSLKDYFKGNDYSLNILITPNINTESNFINSINENVFNNGALIIYMDVNEDLRNNIVHKFSYLKRLDANEVKIHFIDHALLTGEIYKKAKSYIFSIFEKEVQFSNVIVLINRLSFDKNREIYDNNGRDIVHSFINLFIPPSKDPELDCSLCAKIKHYENNIIKNSSLDCCHNIVNLKKNKIAEKDFCSKSSNKIKEREFVKLKYIHSIYYKISQIILDNKKEDNGNIKENIKNILDKIFYESKKNGENKLSFLKAISSYPLNQYLHLKEYAHEILLQELKNVLEKDEPFTIIDFSSLLVILKQLSELGSNALLRKNVIIGSWNLYFKFYDTYFGHIQKNIDENLKKIKQLKGQRKDLYDPNLFNTTFIDDSLKKLEVEIIYLASVKANINSFKYIFQLYIKNTTYNDEAKSLWLGELLRVGNEIIDFDDISISTTLPNNNLFLYFDSIFDKAKSRPYKEFLVLVFYDNTTIIRKALNNFEKEVTYNSHQKNLFFDEGQILKEYCEINLNKMNIKNAFKDIVDSEYYYSYIKKYLDEISGVSIDLLDKLVDLLYAKLFLKKLNDRIVRKNAKTNGIENDIETLLQVYAKIMDADAAFFSMSDLNIGKKYYTISSYNIIEDQVKKIQLLEQDFYTYEILAKEGKYKDTPYIYPMIIRDDLVRNNIQAHVEIKNYHNDLYKENLDSNYDRLNLLLIYKPHYQEDKPIGTITFLYKNQDEINKEQFHIESQEKGRLLLILRNELYQYVDSILNENLLNVWIAKIQSQRKFEKIYSDSDHAFNQLVIEEFQELEKLDSFKMHYKTWFIFSNLLISYLYSNIEKHKKGKLLLNTNKLFSPCNINEVFNEKFLGLIDCLKNDRWKELGRLDIINKIENGVETRFNKYVLQTFIIQCLDNAFKKHLPTNEKIVVLTFDDSKVEISNDFPSHYYNKVKKESEKFAKIKEHIRKLDCDEYSSTTLTSLQGYADNIETSCQYGYEDQNMQFKVLISFKN